MNILWITHEYPPVGGGGGVACRALAREFAAQGHSVTVVTANAPAGIGDIPDVSQKRSDELTGTFPEGSCPLSGISAIEIRRLKCRRKQNDQATFFEMLSFLLAAFKFVPKMVKKRRAGTEPGAFDAAIISFGIPSGPLGWYLKKRFKLPYIVRLGGGDIPGTQKRFNIAYKLLSPALKTIWKNAECVTANSRGLKERAERYYGTARFEVIHNGADSSSGDIPDAPATGTFNIITTARIVERKGIRHVIEALPRIIEATNGNIRYTIAGDGPYRKEIEELAAKLGVNEYIGITGMIPHDDVIKHLRKADVFVLASHWEGMPNAVLEAMAAGLPVIMSDCEGSEELVNGNGYIVKSGDGIAERLAEKILLLYNDRELAEKLGQQSLIRVNANFSWKKSAAEYLELLNTRHSAPRCGIP